LIRIILLNQTSRKRASQRLANCPRSLELTTANSTPQNRWKTTLFNSWRPTEREEVFSEPRAKVQSLPISSAHLGSAFPGFCDDHTVVTFEYIGIVEKINTEIKIKL